MNFLNNKNTVTTFFCSFLSQGGIEVIRFIVAIILARLLLPSDYGLMAVVGIFTGFSTVFIQFTFSPVSHFTDLSKADTSFRASSNHFHYLHLALKFQA